MGRVRRLKFQSQGYHCSIRKATSLWMPVSSSKAIWLLNSSLTWKLIHLCFSYLHFPLGASHCGRHRQEGLSSIIKSGRISRSSQTWSVCMGVFGHLRLLIIAKELDMSQTMEMHEDTGSHTWETRSKALSVGISSDTSDETLPPYLSKLGSSVYTMMLTWTGTAIS